MDTFALGLLLPFELSSSQLGLLVRITWGAFKNPSAQAAFPGQLNQTLGGKRRGPGISIFKVPLRLAPLWKESIGDAKTCDTARAPEGPDNLPRKRPLTSKQRAKPSILMALCGGSCTESGQVGGRAGLCTSWAVLTSLSTEKVILFAGPTGLTGPARVTGLRSPDSLVGRWLGDSYALAS